MVHVCVETTEKVVFSSFRVKLKEEEGKGKRINLQNGSQTLENLCVLDISLTKLLEFFQIR